MNIFTELKKRAIAVAQDQQDYNAHQPSIIVDLTTIPFLKYLAAVDDARERGRTTYHAPPMSENESLDVNLRHQAQRDLLESRE